MVQTICCLTGKLFSGWLEERQRLDSVVSFSSKSITEEDQLLSGWRDVIEVDGCETDMVRQLGAVMSSVPGAKEGKKWINIKGISSNMEGVNLYASYQ